MSDNNGYAVFFHPQALEALGAGIQPYLQDGAAGADALDVVIGIAADLDPVGPRSTGLAVPCRLLIGRKPVAGS